MGLYNLFSGLKLSSFLILHLSIISHIMNHLSQSQTTKIFTFISLLSLGGLPPFTGFIAKWFIIQELAFSQMFLMLLVLLSRALVTLFYYLWISITSLIISRPKRK